MKSKRKGKKGDSKSESWWAVQDPHRAATLTTPGGAICMGDEEPGGTQALELVDHILPPVWYSSVLGTNESVLENHSPFELSPT